MTLFYISWDGIHASLPAFLFLSLVLSSTLDRGIKNIAFKLVPSRQYQKKIMETFKPFSFPKFTVIHIFQFYIIYYYYSHIILIDHKIHIKTQSHWSSGQDAFLSHSTQFLFLLLLLPCFLLCSSTQINFLLIQIPKHFWTNCSHLWRFPPSLISNLSHGPARLLKTFLLPSGQLPC